MRIFLSYRRDDAPGQAGRLRDALVLRFGADAVFQDVSTIRPGEDFIAAVRAAIGECDVMLVVIGPLWATISGQDGTPRLHDPNDYVRLEVGTALTAGKRTIPVTVAGSALPAASALPEELRPLTTRQSVELRDVSWSVDLEALVRGLAGEVRSGEISRHGGVAAMLLTRGAAVGLAGVVVVVLALWVWQPWRAGSGSSQPLPSCYPRFEDETGWTTLPLVASPSGTDAEFLYHALRGAYRQASADRWSLQVRVRATNQTAQEWVYHADWRYNGIVVNSIPYSLSCFSTVAGRELVEAGLSSEALIGIELPVEPRGLIELGTEPRIAISTLG
jgi:hypothetical protein